MGNSSLWLFVWDVYDQVLFYFGGIAGVVIVIWEKWTERPVPWKLILRGLLFCLFVSCFQAWVDEHHNAETLIGEKSKLTSDNNGLQAKLDRKQNEVDYLRDHQQVHIEAGSIPDPNIAKMLGRLSYENQQLKSEPGKELKKNATSLAKEMIEFFQGVVKKYPDPESPDLSVYPTKEEKESQWHAFGQKLIQNSQVQNSEINSALTLNFDPRALSLLATIKSRGAAVSGVEDATIDDAVMNCKISGYWGIQLCAQKLAVVAEELR